jgi:1,6-anhydro-N-acetylmuramate kinase
MPFPSRALAALTAQRSPVVRRTAEVAARRWAVPETDIDAVLDFVARQHMRMNDVLAAGTNGLTILFEAEVVARSRQRFAEASPEVITSVLQRWAGSRVGRLRDFVRFVDSLVSYAALALDAGERPDEFESLGLRTGTSR